MRAKTCKFTAYLIILVVLGLGLACDWEWGSDDDDEDETSSEEVATEDIITRTISNTDSQGEAAVVDLASDTTITFLVEDENAVPIQGASIRFMSDGEAFNAIVYHASGDYLPALYFGTLEDSSWEVAGLGRLSLSQASAFESFSVIVTLIGIAENEIAYDEPSSEGAFFLEEMFDESFTTVCVDKEGLKDFNVFTSGLGDAKTGIIKKTVGGVVFWGANAVSVDTVIEELADEIFKNYDLNTEYLTEILTATERDFAFFKNTGTACGGTGWKLYGQRDCTRCALQVWVDGSKVGTLGQRGEPVYMGSYEGRRTVGVYRECDGEIYSVTCSDVNPGLDHEVVAYLDTCNISSGTGHIEVNGVDQSEVPCD
jgi:hypothetical protein